MVNFIVIVYVLYLPIQYTKVIFIEELGLVGAAVFPTSSRE
jgi:hypothetical protein